MKNLNLNFKIVSYKAPIQKYLIPNHEASHGHSGF